MKQTSIDKLSQVYSYLKDDEQWSYCAKLIKEVLRAETPAPAGSKFDIYRFVSSDKNHPVVQGVYYDGEWRVATDCFKLMAEKGDWGEELQGKIIGKDGGEIEGKYPCWRGILPKDIDGEMQGYEPIYFDKKALSEKIAEYRGGAQAAFGKSIQWDSAWPFSVGGVNFSCKHLWAFVSAGIDTLYIHKREKNRAAIIKTEKYVGAIMPIAK